jgi:hypothetical protein
MTPGSLQDQSSIACKPVEELTPTRNQGVPSFEVAR